VALAGRRGLRTACRGDAWSQTDFSFRDQKM